MKVNNFDKSSTGLNIELNLFYGESYAQTLFDDNFEHEEDKDLLIFKGGNENSTDNVEFYSRGYSQGDIFKVVIPAEDDNEETKEYIHNLLWDTPWHCEVGINGNWDYVEGVDGCYPDFEDVKKLVRKQCLRMLDIDIKLLDTQLDIIFKEVNEGEL